MLNEKELSELKKQLETELNDIEKKIFDLESLYLEETMHCGNVLRGWDNYLSLKSQKNNPPFTKKNKISANERIFSLSSTTSPANKKMEEELEQNVNGSQYATNGGMAYYKRKTKRKTQGIEPRLQRNPGHIEKDDHFDNSDLESSLDSRAKSAKKKKNKGSKFKNKKGV